VLGEAVGLPMRDQKEEAYIYINIFLGPILAHATKTCIIRFVHPLIYESTMIISKYNHPMFV
jgi:hypothetical protein